MPVLNSISKMSEEMTTWRRSLHKIPEIGLKEYKTAEFISNKLTEWGITHHTKIAKTGIIKGRSVK